MSRRGSRLLLWTMVVASLSAGAAVARAEGWRSAQPPPPAPPEGQTGVGVPVPLGHVSDIEFWAPNRGLLMTSGNSVVPAGLYFYDGVAWHELSNVCGGSEGKIAWAGPDDFWTIADQQVGQQGVAGSGELVDRSLCHFLDGRVVASYAEPIGVRDSYQRLEGAACSSSSDCWFGGERLPQGAINTGAFHLHWNGRAVTPVPSLESPEPQLLDPARRVADVAVYAGHFYESVQVQQSDEVPGESSTQPYVLHKIVEGSSQPFVPLIPQEPLSYGAGVAPWELSAFMLSGDNEGLWALAGPVSSGSMAPVTAMLLNASGLKQIPLSDPEGALASGDRLAGVAAEPGTDDAWVSVDGSGPFAHLARIHADGSVDDTTMLPEAGEALGAKGAAGAIACPAAGDCWMATSEGWLFHLGGDYPPVEDPNFESLISSRPLDGGVPFVPPDEAPPDVSGDNPASIPAPIAQIPAPATVPPEHEPLFSATKTRLIGGSTLVLTFTLATKSRVRLVALRGKATVAATRSLTLARGRHALQLRLSRHRWPTRLDLQVRALAAVPLLPAGAATGSPTGGPTTVTTSLRGPIAPESLRGLALP